MPNTDIDSSEFPEDREAKFCKIVRITFVLALFAGIDGWATKYFLVHGHFFWMALIILIASMLLAINTFIKEYNKFVRNGDLSIKKAKLRNELFSIVGILSFALVILSGAETFDMQNAEAHINSYGNLVRDVNAEMKVSGCTQEGIVNFPCLDIKNKLNSLGDLVIDNKLKDDKAWGTVNALTGDFEILKNKTKNPIEKENLSNIENALGEFDFSVLLLVDKSIWSMVVALIVVQFFLSAVASKIAIAVYDLNVNNRKPITWGRFQDFFERKFPSPKF